MDGDEGELVRENVWEADCRVLEFAMLSLLHFAPGRSRWALRERGWAQRDYSGRAASPTYAVAR